MDEYVLSALIRISRCTSKVKQKMTFTENTVGNFRGLFTVFAGPASSLESLNMFRYLRTDMKGNVSPKS